MTAQVLCTSLLRAAHAGKMEPLFVQSRRSFGMQESKRQRYWLAKVLRRKATDSCASVFAAWHTATRQRAARRETVMQAMASRATVVLRNSFQR